MVTPRPSGSSIALLALVAVIGCTVERTPEETLLDFTRAVQDRDAAALFCLSAGAAGAASLGPDTQARRDGFGRWFEAEILAYEESRDFGEIELTGHGVRLTRLFALGRGTFYREQARQTVGDEGLILRTRLDFAYSQIDLSGLSPGTTFYLAGAPVGRVLPVVVPHGAQEIGVEALETVMIDWTLRYEDASDGCTAGYKIASVQPIEGTSHTRSFTWVY